MKSLYASLAPCRKEEVNSGFCKFFKMNPLPQVYSLGFLSPDVDYFT